MKPSRVKVSTISFAMLLCSQPVFAYPLKGTVHDSSTNAALSGVIVSHKATANRVITGTSGVFSLTIGGSAGAQSHQPILGQDRKRLPEVPAGTDTLVFARAGFEQQELAVSPGDTHLAIKLTPLHERPGPSPALFAKPYLHSAHPPGDFSEFPWGPDVGVGADRSSARGPTGGDSPIYTMRGPQPRILNHRDSQT